MRLSDYQLFPDGIPPSLVAQGRWVRIPARAPQVLPIGRDGYMWFIEAGWLFGLRIEASGRVKTGELAGPRDALGIAGLWVDDTFDLVVYPLTEVLVLQVPTKTFEHMCLADSRLGAALMRYQSARYRRILAELHRSTLLDLPRRIDSFLNYLTARFNEAEGPRHPLPHLSLTTLGWAVGAHPVSVCRAMNRQAPRRASAHPVGHGRPN